MKKLSKNEWVAVVVSLVVITIFLTTGQSLLSFFNSTITSSNSSQNMAASNTSFSSSVADFEIQDLIVGTGEEAVSGKILTVNYSGAFVDGKVFDSSYSRGVPFEFTLGIGQVIPGWDKGFDGMKVGGKRRLIVPSAYGYGPAGVPGVIPENATLIFEVELLGVK